jgi:prepilin-type N-terminal cleavage/methylation domain-containing protein
MIGNYEAERRVPPPPTDSSAKAGFTLLELLLVIGVISIVLGAIVGSFDNMSRFFSRENVKADTQKKARFGLDFMIQDIQRAGLNPYGFDGAGILTASATTLQLASDLNFDRDFDDDFETVTYSLNGARLEHTSHLGTETLVGDVSDFRFTYFDTDGNILAEPVTLPDIRSIGVTITLAAYAGRGENVQRNYSTRIRCRNLGGDS